MATTQLQPTASRPKSGAAEIAGLAWWKWLTGALMAYVCYGAFFVAKGAEGFVGGSGGTSRIVFFHVPIAVLTSIAYMVACVYSVGYLRKERTDLDRKASVAVELGFLCCILATVTGSIFAGAQWGSYWNWDPRETSIVIMLLIYAAYLALRGSTGDAAKRGRLSAVYILVTIVPAIFLIWIAPRIVASLHPPDTLARPKNTSMDYKAVLYPSFFAFFMLYTWMFQVRCRALELIERRRMRRVRPSG